MTVEQSIVGAYFKAMKPPVRLSASEWCEHKLILSERSSPWPGKLRFSRTPYMKEVVDCFGDSRIEEITMASSSQVGKTTFIQATIGYAISQDPGPGLMVMPNADLAQSFSETRLRPFFEDCLDLRHEKPSNPDMYKKLEMHFRRMTLSLVGSNSPANISSRPIRYLWLDEVDKFKGATDKEASAEKLATERTKMFWNRKIVRTSTPTLESGDIWQAFLRGDQRRFWVPCPRCGEFQKLVFNQLKWPELRDRDGKWQADRVREQTWYECIACEERITDKQKPRMINRGHWRPDGESSRHRSFQTFSLYSLGSTFGDVSKNFLESRPNPGAFQNFVNSWLGEPWYGGGSNATENEIMAKRGEYSDKECPVAPVAIFISADVQEGCVYYVVRAWCRDESSYLLRYGSMSDLESLNGLATGSSWNTPIGAMKIREGCVDSGDQTDKVYRFAAAFNWVATKGRGESQQQSVPYKWGDAGGVRLLNVNVDFFKSMLQTKIKIPNGAEGCWMLHSGVGLDYADQLTAEAQVESKDRFGRPKRIWKRIRRDNHYLDCEVLQLAMCYVFGVKNLDPIVEGVPQVVKKRTVTSMIDAPKRADGRDWLDTGRE